MDGDGGGGGCGKVKGIMVVVVVVDEGWALPAVVGCVIVEVGMV